MPRNQVPAIDDYWAREVEFAGILKMMESRGVRIDQGKCRQQKSIGETKLWQLQDSGGGLSPRTVCQLSRVTPARRR